MALVVAVGCFAVTAQAALLAYDPFLTGLNPAAGEYKQGLEDAWGPNLAPQNPTIGPTAFYTSAWANIGAQPQAVKAGSLNYFHYPELGGKQEETNQWSCCTYGRSARDILGGIGGGLGGGRDPRLIYQSFLIDFGTQGTDADPMDFGKRGYESWNGAPDDANLSVQVFVNHWAAVDYLSLGVSTVLGGSQTVALGAGDLDLPTLAATGTNGTHLVVLKYDLQTGDGSQDTVSVYLDPEDSIESNWTPAATIVVPTSDVFITSHGAFTQFTFSGGGHIPGAIDEFRWGDTFEDVTPFVPEPSALVLLALGALSLMVVRRK